MQRRQLQASAQQGTHTQHGPTCGGRSPSRGALQLKAEASWGAASAFHCTCPLQKPSAPSSSAASGVPRGSLPEPGGAQCSGGPTWWIGLSNGVLRYCSCCCCCCSPVAASAAPAAAGLASVGGLVPRWARLTGAMGSRSSLTCGCGETGSEPGPTSAVGAGRAASQRPPLRSAQRRACTRPCSTSYGAHTHAHTLHARPHTHGLPCAAPPRRSRRCPGGAAGSACTGAVAARPRPHRETWWGQA